MEALLLSDAAYVHARYQELQNQKRQEDTPQKPPAPLDYQEAHHTLLQQEHWRIVERAVALEKQIPISYLTKKCLVLDNILERLYAPCDEVSGLASPSKAGSGRLEGNDPNAPVPMKELPLPTQIALKMFFRTCQSLREPGKLVSNCRLSVQIASRLPGLLTAMPSCVLSPGLVDDSVNESGGDNVCSVFQQLFLLFGDLLGLAQNEDQACLSANDRATVILAYVALSLKWGRLGYLLKGIELLLENGNEISGERFEPLGPLYLELAKAEVERPQVAFGEEEHRCGYLMSFGKGDHGKLGHGQCTHLSCQEGNCTENKTVPTMIAATRDIQFRKIDSLSTHSIAITAKGEAMAWGNGDKYRLGHGSSSKEYTPKMIEFLNVKGRVRDLACGLGHTLALMESGELYTWGNGSNGRLGIGDTNDRSSPTKVAMPDKQLPDGGESSDPTSTRSIPVRFQHIFCGASHSLAISWDGKAYAWGKNNQGQCGHGHTNDQFTIQEIESFSEIVEEEYVTYAAGGWEHTIFCTASGRVYSCGCGYKDSRRAGIPPVLGHGDCDRRLKPTLIQVLEDAREEIVKVACGWDHSLAVSTAGRVYTWGSGTNGKLGHGDEESCDVPTLVRSLEGKQVKDAKAGCEHTVLLTHDHELWTCGQGDSGRLGHGDNQTRKRPTKIEMFEQCGLKPVALAVGDKYNLVLVTDHNAVDEQDTRSDSEIHFSQSTCYTSRGVSKRRPPVDPRKNDHYKGHHKGDKTMTKSQFGPTWILNLSTKREDDENPAMNQTNSSSDTFVPGSVTQAALYVLGHIDRLASGYLEDERIAGTNRKTEREVLKTLTAQTLLLPFAVDTACEALDRLLQLIRWTISYKSSNNKFSAASKSSNILDGPHLTTQQQMTLALSCLRILQLNLKRVLELPVDAPRISSKTETATSESSLSVRSHLFDHIHELLDGLAGIQAEDIVARFRGSMHQFSDKQTLLALGDAISEEAAIALKTGFARFYPTRLSRCILMREILSECEVEIPSKRTVILSDQLSQDLVMADIFRGLLLQSPNEQSAVKNNKETDEIDTKAMKALMLALLKRSSTEAITHLSNEAYEDFGRESDCFLRLLHALQLHYFSLANRFVFRQYQENDSTVPEVVMSGDVAKILDSLLDYLGSLLTESLFVLKKLHEGSRQHEETIIWRLNGSFFQTLLPSAVECLSMMFPDVTPEQTLSAIEYVDHRLLIVERVLPNLHEMLKILDEVSWKMHTAGDAGNQESNDCHIGGSQRYESQDKNWFVELGDACAILCGRLSCELLQPLRTFQLTSQDKQNSKYSAVVLSEGQLRPGTFKHPREDPSISNFVAAIIEWEALGIFEVEDELVGWEVEGSSFSPSESASDDHSFLTQVIECNDEPNTFWSWIATKLSYPTDFRENVLTLEMQNLLTVTLVVVSWHLGLTKEFRHCYEFYTTTPVETSGVISEKISTCFKTLNDAAATVTKLQGIDQNAVEIAIAASRLLLQLQPNSDLMPHILHYSSTSGLAWTCANDFVVDLIQFLIEPVDLAKIRRALIIKEGDIALSRTGICVLHDLLRKLTTSSTRSCLLQKFVSITCTQASVGWMTSALRKVNFTQESDGKFLKAVENLYVRLARIVSSDDTSMELKERSLLAWVVPFSTDRSGNENAVSLIAKSGIMGTLVELLLGEANVIDAHKIMNLNRPLDEIHSPGKLTPVMTLLFSQSRTQTFSLLAWEAFCAISMQLSYSEAFEPYKRTFLLRAGESAILEKEPLTARNSSMSPRRRLTLPKKTVVLSIDEIIDQMIDGLYLMLKRGNSHVTGLMASAKKFASLLLPSAVVAHEKRDTDGPERICCRVFSLGCPLQIPQGSVVGIENMKQDFTGNEVQAANLTLSFWMYADLTTEKSHGEKPFTSSAQPNASSTSILAFGSGKASSSNDSTSTGKDSSLIVFSRYADANQVHIGVLVQRLDKKDGCWHEINLDDSIPGEKWVHVALVFDSATNEPVMAFIDGKNVALHHQSNLLDNGIVAWDEILKNAQCWTQMVVGGDFEVRALTKSEGEESLTEASNQSNATPLVKILPKQGHNYFSGILDDVIIFRSRLSNETIAQIHREGTVLFQLKQRSILETHCSNLLRLLCRLVIDYSISDTSSSPVGFSDHWINVLMSMLLNASSDESLNQMYLCSLLQQVMPRTPSLPDVNLQRLSRSLFGLSSMDKSWNRVEEIFRFYNARENSTGLSKQNKIIWRMMQQQEMLRYGMNSALSPMLSMRTKLSLKFAASVELFQTLCASQCWSAQIDLLIAKATVTFQSAAGLERFVEDGDLDNVSELAAVFYTLSGFSEDTLNGYHAKLDDPVLPSPVKMRVPFGSVFSQDNMSISQTENVRALIAAILKEEIGQVVCLAARKDVLTKCQSDISAVNARDETISSIVRLRSCSFRFLMTTLLREQQSTKVGTSWHHFVLDNYDLAGRVLCVAASYTKEYVLMALGPDAKTALKLRRLRYFIKQVLHCSKLGHATATVSLTDLDKLQWHLWEESMVTPSRNMPPWWEQNKDADGKVSLEVVGGDVEIVGLKVKALEHFPTVRLPNSNICANTGLWYYEVMVLSDGLMQIGYVDGDFTADSLQGQGVGDHANSWAFDGFRCKKWNVTSYDYGEHWRVDDVVGVLLDTDRMEMSYFLNGKFLGVAFSGVPITSSSKMCPAASLNVHQCAQFNFGAVSHDGEGDETTKGANFQHLPTLDTDEDQSRLRPVIFAFQNGGKALADAASTSDGVVKTSDPLRGWDSTSSDSDTSNDGDFMLDPTNRLGLQRADEALGLASRDGVESCINHPTVQNDQHRRNLVDGLTGLGFPLEWATRCASESNIPMDESGAVTWILEQMEKVGVEGATMPPGFIPNEDELEDSGQSTLQSNMRLTQRILRSNEKLDVEGSSNSPLTLEINRTDPTSDTRDANDEQDVRAAPVHQNVSTSLRRREANAPSVVNVFLEAEKNSLQSDNANDALYPSSNKHQGLDLHINRLTLEYSGTSKSTEESHLTDGQGVHDITPLRIAVDSTVAIAYARQSFVSLLLLASQSEERPKVYAMVQNILSNDKTSSQFYQFLRLVLGFDTEGVQFDFNSASKDRSLEQSLCLQQALVTLLQFEVKMSMTDGPDPIQTEPSRLLLFESLCGEMLCQCERGVILIGRSRSRKAVPAVWLAWVSTIVFRFLEMESCNSSSKEAERQMLADIKGSPFCNTHFVQKLLLLATSTSQPWKYVAFRLISRLLSIARSCEAKQIPHFITKATTISSIFDSTMLENLTELFTIRYRREMLNKVFFTDVISALFSLLVRFPKLLNQEVFTYQSNAKNPAGLLVNGYSSTHAIVSWDQSSCASNDGTNGSTESKVEIEPSIMALEVRRRGAAISSAPVLSKVLPSKGTYTIRNLLPDTQYVMRLVSLSGDSRDISNASSISDLKMSFEGEAISELIIQTQPEPVFELDKDTMGKNLLIIDQTLSAKNTVNKKWHSVRASVAFEEGVHQWQVRLDTCVSKNIFIGICTAEASMENYIGSDAYGYGFLANKAVWHNKAKLHSYGEIFKQGDTIQVTLDCNAKTLAFSRNGEYLGIAASNLRAGSRSGSSDEANCRWYPAFSMYNKDDKLTLIPPPPASWDSSPNGHPQNASALELIEQMQDVLEYQHLVECAGDLPLDATPTQLVSRAFDAFESWKSGELSFREISLGHVIGIDTSKSATDKYGLASDDTVFTSQGQCVVIGEYRHELWYEVEEVGSSSLDGVAIPQLSSWSLNTCREMLASPDEYPIHRHHKYKLQIDESTDAATGIESESDSQSLTARPQDQLAVSLESFVDAQKCKSLNTFAMDAKLITVLETIATFQALSNPTLLSFSDTSAALLLEKFSLADDRTKGVEPRHILARIGLLLHVNRCLYNTVRLTTPRNTFATSLELYSSTGSSSTNESYQVSPIAAMLNSSRWTSDDPSAFSWMSSLAARLLFSAQKERLIDEALSRSKTVGGPVGNQQGVLDREDDEANMGLPTIKVSYSNTPATPFWRQEAPTRQRRFRLPVSASSSIFVQLATQLAAQDAREWRREFSQPFEAIPISQSFHVIVEKQDVTENQEDGNENEDQQPQQPSSKQTAQYLQLFESAVREIQSPRLPLFAPAQALDAGPLQLDVNTELFSPQALAHSGVRRPSLLLWFYCVGQLFGIAWRSKLILPLQFISSSFWNELTNPVEKVEDGHERDRIHIRALLINAVRDGLYSIIPSRCVDLSPGDNLRERLSDLDVDFVARLERNAVYLVARQKHHDLFWKVVNAFSSVERRMLEQFINPEHRSGSKQPESIGDEASIFVLEIAETLADGRDHPDSCYPVIVPVSPRSSRLHLPAYSTAQTLRHKLLLAMTNVPFM